jgi:hypothetical protein
VRVLGGPRRSHAAALLGEQEGKWLMTEKDKQKAKDVKADWLKGFPGGKEQK